MRAGTEAARELGSAHSLISISLICACLSARLRPSVRLNEREGGDFPGEGDVDSLCVRMRRERGCLISGYWV